MENVQEEKKAEKVVCKRGGKKKTEKKEATKEQVDQAKEFENEKEEELKNMEVEVEVEKEVEVEVDSSSIKMGDAKIAKKYQKKTQREHMLTRPDTYMGSIHEVETKMWIWNEETKRIELKSIQYLQGLYKLFDESLVNCRDHMVRMRELILQTREKKLGEEDKDEEGHVLHPVQNIEISILPNGEICMRNDGNGIDIQMHPKEKLYIPEMIFGHLLTSANYDDEDQNRIVGGKNGIGVKLVFVWSTRGSVETVDHKVGKKYVQVFRNNLEVIDPPTIMNVSAKRCKPYTEIRFVPDYARFGISGLSSDMRALFAKRVYDLCAVADKGVKVKFNDALLPTRNFMQYVDLYLGSSKTEAPRVHEVDASGRWEYVVSLSQFAQGHEFLDISFVNGIYTSKGGSHVTNIINQITRKAVTLIKEKKKIDVTQASIKEQLILFLRCDVPNPNFEGQTKDILNHKFTSTNMCVVSDAFVEKVLKLGVMDMACEINKIKEGKAFKRTDGSKCKTIHGIPKLLDANYAGTTRSRECMLIICEGDSAKAGIVSGLTKEDRNVIGVYPVGGKIMNVRDELVTKVNANKEIKEIKQILGLESGREYKSMEEVHQCLRYSKVIFMTDQDKDGSHIKGLGINLFQYFWPSLTYLPGFLGFINTPILKAKKGNQSLKFYNEGEYEQWKQQQDMTPAKLKQWKIKYYKGLGTSTGAEFREYFLEKCLISFVRHPSCLDEDDNAIDMVFNKKRADDRKLWLASYDRNAFLQTSPLSLPSSSCSSSSSSSSSSPPTPLLSSQKKKEKNMPASTGGQSLELEVTYKDFIDKELIHFSKYDCDRSIPNLMDGLKRSLRKILFCAFKKNLHEDIKVAQFSGYVSEHSGYLHGEASLNAAIVGLAQNFVGSNNINLFVPSGQFGTRLQGGKDSASERYIYTCLHRITRSLFREEDDSILEYLDDDGQSVEPLYYAPILPFVLVNGSKGIGTGFSTHIPSFNPSQIVQYLLQKLDSTLPQEDIFFLPFYEGFKGTILPTEEGETKKFIVSGSYEDDPSHPDKLIIRELPVGTWTDKYKEFLEETLHPSTPPSSSSSSAAAAELSQKNKIKKSHHHEDDTSSTGGPTLKLSEWLTVNLKSYEDLSTDQDVFMVLTLTKGKRNELSKSDMMKALKLTSNLSLHNMHLFDHEEKLKKYNSVSEIIDAYYEVRLGLYQKRKDTLLRQLQEEVNILSNKTRFIQCVLDHSIDLRNQSNEQVDVLLQSMRFDVYQDSFDYLLNLPMRTVTLENVAKYTRQRHEKELQFAQLQSKSVQELWRQDLIAFQEQYELFRNEHPSQSQPPLSSQKRKEKNTSLTAPKRSRTREAGGGGGAGTDIL